MNLKAQPNWQDLAQECWSCLELLTTEIAEGYWCDNCRMVVRKKDASEERPKAKR